VAGVEHDEAAVVERRVEGVERAPRIDRAGQVLGVGRRLWRFGGTGPAGARVQAGGQCAAGQRGVACQPGVDRG
jgi:hypothetical protein